MVRVNGTAPIGNSGAARATVTDAVAPTLAVAASGPVATSPNLAQTSGLAASMAASPPVDSDRVATIRKAIAERRFPILPATIADRLIALKLQWNPNGTGNDAA